MNSEQMKKAKRNVELRKVQHHPDDRRPYGRGAVCGLGLTTAETSATVPVACFNQRDQGSGGTVEAGATYSVQLFPGSGCFSTMARLSQWRPRTDILTVLVEPLADSRQQSDHGSRLADDDSGGRLAAGPHRGIIRRLAMAAVEQLIEGSLDGDNASSRRSVVEKAAASRRRRRLRQRNDLRRHSSALLAARDDNAIDDTASPTSAADHCRRRRNWKDDGGGGSRRDCRRVVRGWRVVCRT